jgi:flavodoxin
MRALVVYESMFGNTRQVAEAIRDGLATAVEVEAVEVGTAPATVPGDVGLLVVGGPTHAFGMTRAATRGDAVKKYGGPVVSDRIGIREWMDGLQRPAGEVRAVTFDTTFRKARFMGRAGKKAEKKLRELGFRIVAPSEPFWVSEVKGPMEDGELDRAKAWGASFAERLAAAR